MSNFNFNSSSLLFRIVFVISLIVITITALVSYKHITNLNKSRDLVIHSYEVQLELERIISYVKDAETGYRGYLLYGDSLFLDSYAFSREKVNSTHLKLQKITADNTTQQKKLKELHHLIVLRYTYFSNKYEDKDFYKKYYETNGKNVMDQIRDKVNEMISLENKLLQRREYNFKDSVSYTPFYTLMVILTTLFFVIITYLKINNDFKRIEQTNSSLKVSQESINQVEILGNYSSWTWNLEKNEFQFSDNHFRLHGLEPNSLSTNKDYFLKFVHPEDLKLTSDAYAKVIHDESLSTIDYRIFREDGELRHLRSVGRLFINRFDEKIIIGTTQDVTEDVIKKIILREKNIDLERNNKELIEFNYVASHDLQEPLRKIQTFISRINEKEHLSENGIEYMERILIAASRMRVLIEDLLQYSRTNKSNTTFEEVDLNEIATRSLQELSQLIEDSKATISFSELPTITGIPFQLRQLFINLISNSIKYKKQFVPPIIEVSYHKIKANEEVEIDDNSNRMYHKITILDNGIGFDPKESKKIFLLFNRLHIEENYPGTGVGLAICKKIVNNHYGFICAVGQPDEGAKIVIYLPTEY
ncbi:MAG: CHASE3 domain-containing protein [Flavobacterium sp.]